MATNNKPKPVDLDIIYRKPEVLNPPVSSPVVAQPVAPQANTQSLQDQFFAAQKAQRIAELENAMRRNLGQLDVEKETVTPSYAGARSQARTQSRMGAEDFSKFLETRGLAQSGAASQGEIASNVALQGRIGQLTTAEQRDLADIERRRSGIMADTEFAKQSAATEFDLLGLQSRIEQERQAAELARQDALRADAQSREDFQTSILANYNDLSAYKDRLIGQNAPQWQIDQAEAARQQKIIELNLDPRTGQPLPVDTTPQLTSSTAALQLWEQLGVANESISRALGIPVGTRFTQSAARATGATGTSQAPIGQLPPKQVIALAESSLRGTSGNTSADRMVQLNESGYFDNLTPSEIKTLMNKFGVTELMLEQAENRATIPAKGITLPSGRNINQPLQSGISPTTGGFTGTSNMIR